MQDDTKKSEDVKTDIKEPYSFYTQEEINNVVKGFIDAYISGDTKIDFPTTQELIKRAKVGGEELRFREAERKEIENKKSFVDLVEICTGGKSVTTEELKMLSIDYLEKF